MDRTRNVGENPAASKCNLPPPVVASSFLPRTKHPRLSVRTTLISCGLEPPELAVGPRRRIPSHECSSFSPRRLTLAAERSGDDRALDSAGRLASPCRPVHPRRAQGQLRF